MDYQDFLGLFGGVKMRDSNRAMCQCPCHPDKKPAFLLTKSAIKSSCTALQAANPKIFWLQWV